VKVFADTNVLVAAFATRGLCADVIRIVLAEHELVVSPGVLAELTRVLVEKFGVPEATVREIDLFLRTSATVVAEPPGAQRAGLRDPDDEAILAAAFASDAEVLVTGDKDLLEIAERAALRIVDPRGFWQLVRKPRPTR
jgi:putative PIN family toxin of toxin-antitoxin system